MKTEVLIIGGGLAGLSLADQLHRAGRDFILVEARHRFGGRIKTEVLNDAYFDMGPAWFWPGQPRIAALIERFGLTVFEQHHQGALTYEDETGAVQQGRGHASMQGSYRLKGGLDALISRLADKLPEMRKIMDAAVTRLERENQDVTTTLSNGQTVTATQVVLALPPRIAAQNITFVPNLPAAAVSQMNEISTWMAGQAKAVAVYDTAFWRDAGLSGDATSRAGPMVEIHDASPAKGGPFALFGFIGVPPSARSDQAILRQQVLLQFERLFGAQAAKPKQLYIKDWAFDPMTSTPLDLAPLYAHPTYGLPQAMQGLWEGKLSFGNTEVAPQFGGYLEGALEAADNVVLILRDQDDFLHAKR